MSNQCIVHLKLKNFLKNTCFTEKVMAALNFVVSKDSNKGIKNFRFNLIGIYYIFKGMKFSKAKSSTSFHPPKIKYQPTCNMKVSEKYQLLGISNLHLFFLF